MSEQRKPSEIDQEEADAEALARARADLAAGRTVPHEEVATWLKKWGAGERVPMPREWLE